MVNKITATPIRHNDSPAPQKPKAHKSDKKDDKSFSDEMEAQAAATQGAQSQSRPKSESSESKEVKNFQEGNSSKLQEQSSSKGLSEGKSLAVNAKTAASPNTGAAVAGLKPGALMNPLGKEWVFDGADENPNLKPLFGPDSQTRAIISQGDLAGQNLMTQPIAEKNSADALNRSISTMEMRPGMTRGDAAVNGVAQQSGMDQGWEMTDELNGQVLSSTQAVQGQEQPQSNAKGNHALSGADFLSTLASIRAATQDQKGGAFGNSGNMGQGSNSDPGSAFAQQPNVQFGQIGSSQPPAHSSDELGSHKSKSFDGDPSVALMPNAHSLNGLNASPGFVRAPEVPGHVTQGAMTQDRLTSETLSGLGANIKNLTPQGGGEIHIRLRPDNLGELHLRVVTDGQQVGLHIQASSEKAKQILESSLHDLRDKLASHQLSLGKVDAFVAPLHSMSHSSGAGTGDSMDSRSQNQNLGWGGMQDMANGQGGNPQAWSEARESAWNGDGGWNSTPLRTAVPSRGSANPSAAYAQTPGRRLDVLA